MFFLFFSLLFFSLCPPSARQSFGTEQLNNRPIDFFFFCPPTILLYATPRQQLSHYIIVTDRSRDFPTDYYGAIVFMDLKFFFCFIVTDKRAINDKRYYYDISLIILRPYECPGGRKSRVGFYPKSLCSQVWRA